MQDLIDYPKAQSLFPSLLYPVIYVDESASSDSLCYCEISEDLLILFSPLSKNSDFDWQTLLEFGNPN